MKNYAIILGAGSGNRFGSFKQVEKINKKTVYLYSLDFFINTGLFSSIFLVVPKKLIKLTPKQKADAKVKKMREIIKDKLVGLAEDMSSATSLKEQAAIQAKIQALVNFVPGFQKYGGQIQAGGDFYGSDSIYTATNVPENNRGLLNGLASQLLHEQMIDMQYK